MCIRDRPTTGLDPIMTTELLNLTEKMNRELGIAIVMVTHDTHCAVKYSKNILCLYKENYFYGKTSDFISTDKGKLYIGGHKPVSYTHLDVYKRQIIRLTTGRYCHTNQQKIY